jgi:hypothetical protein
MTPARARLRASASVLCLIATVALASVGTAASAASAQPSKVAKSTTYDSLHWVGYTFPVGHVTGVRADWTEPNVHGKKGTEEFVWLGIGGWNQTDNNIIQVGTFAYFPSTGGRNEGVWYERVPVNPEALFPLVGVDAGDHIESSITLLPGGGHRWRISLEDTTIGTSFAITVKFDSREAYPSFVVEDPDKGAASPNGPFYPFPLWKKVTFTGVEVRIRSTWTPIAKIASYRVDMVRGRKTLATAGPISKKSSFTATQR